jgi:hypothetical protein
MNNVAPSFYSFGFYLAFGHVTSLACNATSGGLPLPLLLIVEEEAGGKRTQ